MKCDAFTSTASPGCTRPSNSPSTSATLCARTIFPGSMPARAAPSAMPCANSPTQTSASSGSAAAASPMPSWQAAAKSPQLAHVAEHGDARAGDLERAERGQRGPHGVGVRVVGVVHHDEPPAGMQQFLAPGLGQRALEGARDGGEVHAGRQADGGGRARVRHVVQAAQAERARLPQDGKVFRRVGRPAFGEAAGGEHEVGPPLSVPAPRLRPTRRDGGASRPRARPALRRTPTRRSTRPRCATVRARCRTEGSPTGRRSRSETPRPTPWAARTEARPWRARCCRGFPGARYGFRPHW